jgi:hypothetical protein
MSQTLSLTRVELDRIVATLAERHSRDAAGYDHRRYPADAYDLLVRAFSAPADTSGGDIERALKWKYGHWRKLNYPHHHRQMAARIAGRWSDCPAGPVRQPKEIFDFWMEALQGQYTQPYITVTFLLHLLRPADFPIMDQHTFRSMNHLMRSVRPGWVGKQRPLTYDDLITYTEFFNELHAHWSMGGHAPSRSNMDKSLMVYGQWLRRHTLDTTNNDARPGPGPGLRIVAVDWSGARDGAQRKIWLAEATGSTLVRLECGRNRIELADHLIALATQDPELIVGLDFAFSFPEWFVRDRGLSSGHELWRAALDHGEEWLSTSPFPFWGRPRCRRPANIPEEFRRTDRQVPAVSGIRPKSVFQIGGAGAVGTGSIRGMALLHRLSRNGFAIWPFDRPVRPLLIEIYPRVLTGPVNKSSQTGRRRYLRTHYPHVRPDLLEKADASEDAFDAAVSALVMAAQRGNLLALQAADDEVERLEGRIWLPRRE